MSAVLARRIPGATCHVVAGAGHMASMEQPAAVNELLTRFLDGLPPPPGGHRGTGYPPARAMAVPQHSGRCTANDQ